MSQQDNFSGGFLVGAVVGGIVGGVLGALLASKRLNEFESSEDRLLKSERLEPKAGGNKKRSLKPTNGHTMEVARRSLEDKIAQLNDAIDDVRQQLNGVNGTSTDAERSIIKEP